MVEKISLEGQSGIIILSCVLILVYGAFLSSFYYENRKGDAKENECPTPGACVVDLNSGFNFFIIKT